MNSAQPSQSAPPERRVVRSHPHWPIWMVWDTEKGLHPPVTLGNFRDSLQSGYPAQMLVTPVLPGVTPTLVHRQRPHAAGLLRHAGAG